MELGQVEAFVEANRRGSISRAAEALGLTQPTCTARLHGLERELGAPLLVRGRRGVSLTPAGRRFLPRAVAALDSLRRGATETKAGTEARGGRLAIGIASDLALYLAPRALARFAARHPQVETLVRSGHSRFVADLLRAEEIELALVSQLVLLPDLASRLLFTEAVPVVVAPAHRLARRSAVKMDELAPAGLVLRGGLAVVLRIVAAAIVSFLLAIPYLQLAGGVVLAVIAYRLVRPGAADDHAKVRPAGSLREAVLTILVADAAMSVENVLGV